MIPSPSLTKLLGTVATAWLEQHGSAVPAGTPWGCCWGARANARGSDPLLTPKWWPQQAGEQRQYSGYAHLPPLRLGSVPALPAQPRCSAVAQKGLVSHPFLADGSGSGRLMLGYADSRGFVGFNTQRNDKDRESGCAGGSSPGHCIQV